MDILNIRIMTNGWSTICLWKLTEQDSHPWKTWQDCVEDDMKIFSLSQEMQSGNKWRWKYAITPGKTPFQRRVCVCVHVYVSYRNRYCTARVDHSKSTNQSINQTRRTWSLSVCITLISSVKHCNCALTFSWLDCNCCHDDCSCTSTSVTHTNTTRILCVSIRITPPF